MQMIWFGAVGPTDDALAGGRLIGAVMRVFSSGRGSTARRTIPRSTRSSSSACCPTTAIASGSATASGA